MRISEKQGRTVRELVTWAHELGIEFSEHDLRFHCEFDDNDFNPITVTYTSTEYVVSQLIDVHGNGCRAIGEIDWIYDESDPDFLGEDAFRAGYTARQPRSHEPAILPDDERIRQIAVSGRGSGSAMATEIVRLRWILEARRDDEAERLAKAVIDHMGKVASPEVIAETRAYARGEAKRATDAIARVDELETEIAALKAEVEEQKAGRAGFAQDIGEGIARLQEQLAEARSQGYVPGVTVTELNEAEVDEMIEGTLERLGCTFDELAEMSRTRSYPDLAHRLAWGRIGGWYTAEGSEPPLLSQSKSQ